jgi:diacylglycerol O-acyltransferase
MQTMSPLDASFLHIESSVSHMHIGSMELLDGPAPSQGAIAARVAEKLPLIPRYRQKVRFLPLSLGRPVWVDDPDFDLTYHLRRTALPEPGGDDELRNLMGRVMSHRLDRRKPLWEIWIVEGLAGDRWALINKLHHCMVDGVSGTDLIGSMFDSDGSSADPAPWQPEPEPSDGQLLVSALAGRVTQPYEVARTVWAAARGPRRTVRQAKELAGALGSLRTLLTPSAATLNGRIGPHRRWAWARGRLSDVKAIRARHGGTVNDVVLAAIAGAFRTLLLSRGEPVEGVIVRTLVPVSVRASGDRSSRENKVSAMFADLPVGLEDPVARLEAIRLQMEDLKERRQALAATTLTSMGGFAPAMLLGLAGRASTRTSQRSVNTVATNVPGPQQPVFLLGCRMLEYLPFVPLANDVRIVVAIVSYDGKLGFGITGDWETVPDVQILCDAIEDSFAELLAIGPPPPGAAPAKADVQHAMPRSSRRNASAP